MAIISEIKLKNFKSFKQVTIPFSPGFNCIIGPNGSGKSNINDAIRFVLGYSSLRALRAKTVSDLIYGDGDKAEITLTLANLSEGNTTNIDGKATILRKIKRDGGTAYWLNGKKTTKSVVMDFLRSEGIEVGMHNVIAQGEVDRIVRLNPKERRGIIDEIAGVAEFEAKKKESMTELGKVEQKINDASIVLKEREGILEELEKEKNAALKHLKLKDEQKQVKGSIIVTQYRKVEAEFETLVTKLSELSKSKDEYEKESLELESKLSELEKKKGSISGKISAKDTRNIYAEVEVLRSKVSVLQNVRTEKDHSVSRINEEIETLEIEEKGLNEKLSTFTGAKKESATRAVEIRERLKVLKVERERVSKEWEGKRTKFAIFDKQLDELKEKLSVMKQEVAKLSGKVEITETSAGKEGELLTQLKEIKVTITENSNNMDSLFTSERELNKSVQKLDSELLAMKEDLAAARGSGGAIPRAVSFVLGLKSQFPGIFGTVADLYTVDKRFSVASETAAGARLFYIIVDSTATATEVVKLMKQRGAGRATFIPLNVTGAEKRTAPKGTLGHILDFVKFDRNLKGVFGYVFGNTYPVENIDSFKMVGKGSRLVTLDGDISEASGVISGGTSIKRSIRDALRTNKLESELSDLKSIRESSISELYALNESMAKLRRDSATGEIRRKELEIELSSIQKGKDSQDVQAQITEKEADIGDFEREIMDIQGEKERIRVGLANAEDEKALSVVDSEVTKISSELSALEEKLKGEDGILLQERATAIIKRLDILGDDKKEFDTEISQIDIDLKKNKKQLDSNEEKIADESRELEKLYAEVKKLQIDVDEQNVEKGKLTRKLDRTREDTIRFGASKEAIEIRLIDLKTEADAYPDIEIINKSKEKLQQRLSEIENELEVIGFANLKAPETYDEKLEEFKLIKSRVDLLADEREAVLKMIEEVETRKKDVFMKAFVSVNEHFKKLAFNMFKNEATLLLENEANPFEGGLHMLLKLGKKNRNIEAMSGGEKTLLTTAFVFAMHMHRPAQFYILDEIDAALDKENSKRLSELVKELSKSTQFIVVSHNDAVIPFADIALGVTKTKYGSRIVSVKLTTNDQADVKMIDAPTTDDGPNKQTNSKS